MVNLYIKYNNDENLNLKDNFVNYVYICSEEKLMI
jgi:hypothetical protein